MGNDKDKATVALVLGAQAFQYLISSSIMVEISLLSVENNENVGEKERGKVRDYDGGRGNVEDKGIRGMGQEGQGDDFLRGCKGIGRKKEGKVEGGSGLSSNAVVSSDCERGVGVG
ncbi:hypothetical protein Ancab_002347 [Ancistrocladus abbreviatus]